jgi:glycine/D-amino acid oxidase-like deaminating enzyme
MVLNTDRFDVLIIGAGIVGSAAARECALAGLRVGIIESTLPAAGATAAGMGHIVVMDDSPAQLALTVYSRSLWLAESAKLPAAVEYKSRGTMWVAADDEEMAEVHAKTSTYAEAGVASQVLNPGELRSLEPNLRDGLAGGLLVPDDGVSYPPAAAAFFLAEAQRLGTKVFPARALSAANGQVRLADGTSLVADRVVLAVGTECDLLPALPLKKRKGHLVITDSYPGFIRHQLVELGYLKSAHKVAADSVAFNIQPRVSGQLVVGSSRQYGSEDPAVEPAILKQMMDRAKEYMPKLADLSIQREWTGFRAATVDKLPLIGTAQGISDDPTLWLAVGFEGLGITSSLGAARLVADGILGRASAIDTTPYLPSRMTTPNTREPKLLEENQ